MKTISWNDFMQGIANLNENSLPHEEITNIKCPKCGELVYKMNDTVFTSYPPKHKYKCKKCGWSSFC